MYKKVIISLFCLICISCTFALYSNHSIDVADDSNPLSDINDNNVNFDSVKSISSLPSVYDNIHDKKYDVGNGDEFVEFVNHEVRHYLSNDSYYVESYYGLEYVDSFGFVEMVDGELRHYINNYSAYYLEFEGMSDTYIQCCECGLYIPVGNITKPVLSNMLCHDNNMSGRINLINTGTLMIYDGSQIRPILNSDDFHGTAAGLRVSEYWYEYWFDCAYHFSLFKMMNHPTWNFSELVSPQHLNSKIDDYYNHYWYNYWNEHVEDYELYVPNNYSSYQVGDWYTYWSSTSYRMQNGFGYDDGLNTYLDYKPITDVDGIISYEYNDEIWGDNNFISDNADDISNQYGVFPIVVSPEDNSSGTE